jgi:flavin-binding protein dodecin
MAGVAGTLRSTSPTPPLARDGEQDKTRETIDREVIMGTVARITTISSRSETSFEDAIRTGVERASSTLRNVSGAWVKEQKVEVSNGTISSYDVTIEVTFVLED